jgi:phenylacetate-CoA ligase
MLDGLQDATEYLAAFDMYTKRFENAGVTPGSFSSLEGFRDLPTMRVSDLVADFQETPPFGSLVPDGQRVVRCNFTPSPHMDSMPVVWTEADVETNRMQTGDAYRAVGLTNDDVVLNTGDFTPFPFGWIVADAVEEIGATHIPTGPGDTDEQIEIIESTNVTAIVGFPSFIERIANEADAPLDSIEIVIAGGEPFTAIDGYRERVRNAFGGQPTVVDAFGLAETGPGYVAIESREEAGMHLLTDRFLPEVIDPETGELVERGEKGELVLTTLTRESVPLLRFRTGDLTVLEKRDSEFGEYVLPAGVKGRTDDRLKVKGVKLYPGEVQMHLAGVDGINPRNVAVRIDRQEGQTDWIHLIVNADAKTVDEADLRSSVESVIGITVDELTVDDEFETENDVIQVDDRR